MSNFDYPVMESVVKNIIKEKQPFERLEVKKEDLLEMFKVNSTFLYGQLSNILNVNLSIIPI